MELSKALDLVAGKCKILMELPPVPFAHDRTYKLYQFIKEELQNNDVIKNISIINIADAKKILGLILSEMPEREREWTYQVIYSKILIDAPEYYSIFRVFYNLYRKKMDYSILVKIVLSTDIIRIICYAEHSELIKDKPIQTESERIKDELNKYGFFELPKVASLTVKGQGKLIELICSNKLPYRIAMFDFLGFIEHLNKEYFKTFDSRDKEISRWFNSDKDGRAVSGYVNSLVKKPKDGRYKAHLHNELVQKDYHSLK